MDATLENTFERELECHEGVLRIQQQEIGDVGCVVWDAAIVLSKYFLTKNFTQTHELTDKRVIELGSGTGVVGLVLAHLGADVIATDLSEFVPLMELNGKVNKDLLKGSFKAETLKWGQDVIDFLPPFDFIVMADVIYYEESLQPLVKTLLELSNKDTTLLMSYEERYTGNKQELQETFFKLVQEHFTTCEIPQEEQDSRFSCEDIHIIKMKRRS